MGIGYKAPGRATIFCQIPLSTANHFKGGQPSLQFIAPNIRAHSGAPLHLHWNEMLPHPHLLRGAPPLRRART